ncbi:DUF4199 domain-containing protein [Aquimarina sp. 2201CG1-2-11]|uniref:DUF4199 domain-containing protein n=1 Tax=Aquimarina discodermiae TaxID=3231043 RepID=UPI0034619A3D
MKNTIKKFGFYAFVASAIVFFLMLYLGKNLDFGIQEVLGYISIFVSLSFVFLGIKYFRDKENNGTVNLGKALIIGVVISLFAALAFGIVDTFYLIAINPDFPEQYMEYAISNMKETLPANEFEIEKEKLINNMKNYSNPYFGGLIMFITVFMIGVVVSIISSVILQRKSISS